MSKFDARFMCNLFSLQASVSVIFTYSVVIVPQGVVKIYGFRKALARLGNFKAHT